MATFKITAVYEVAEDTDRLAKRKITVNCVAPGLIESDMTDSLPLDKIIDSIPARRIGKAEEVAALVAFLCSPDAAYITRQVVSVNGGLC